MQKHPKLHARAQPESNHAMAKKPATIQTIRTTLKKTSLLLVLLPILFSMVVMSEQGGPRSLRHHQVEAKSTENILKADRRLHMQQQQQQQQQSL